MNSTNHTVVVNLLDMPLMSNYWNISGNDLVVRSEEKLGEGTFAECYKGLLWGKPVAVKVLFALYIELSIGVKATTRG